MDLVRKRKAASDYSSSTFTELHETLYQNSFSNAKKKLIFVEIIRRLKADPEINPNRSSELLTYSFKYGTIEDSLFLIKHPRYDLSNVNCYHMVGLPLKDLSNIWNAVRDAGGACPSDYRIPRNLEFGDRFGYLYDYLDYLWDNDTDTWDEMYYRPSVELISACVCCFLPIKKAHVIVAESDETIRMHLECSLHFALSFIRSVQNPNLYEKSIIPYPGFSSSREVRPSFIFFIASFFSERRTLLEFLTKLAKPKRFIRQYSKDIEFLAEIAIVELNDKILSIRFRADPRYTACPAADCNGFALIPPDEEKLARCTHCEKTQQFVGSKIQQERAVDKSTAQKTIQNNQNIRACPTCGKLVERRGGCPKMTCPVGHPFDWNRASERVPTDILHF